MMLMMTADLVAEVSSVLLRVLMLFINVFSTERILPRVDVMLLYQVLAAAGPVLPMLATLFWLVEMASDSSEAAWSTGVPLTVFWNSCCCDRDAALVKSASSAVCWACSFCRSLRPWGGNCLASRAPNSVARWADAWSSARASAVSTRTSLASCVSLVPPPERLVNVSSVSIEFV